MPSQIEPRRKWWHVVTLLALGAVAFFHLADRGNLMPTARAQVTTVGDGAPARNEAGDMECVSYCSVTRPGTTLMEVKWRLASRALATNELRATSGQQGLEATVYAEGFERGLYAVVSTVKPKTPFRAFKAAGAAVAPQPSKLPGLEKLTVTDVATRLDKPAQPLRLLRPQAEAEPVEWMAARVEGLNPGMEYTYRVSGRKSVVACQALVCPVDRIAAPPPPKPKPSPTPR